VVAGAPAAVTGMAWATGLGTGLAEVWERLLAGDSALRPTPAPFPVRNELAATVPDLPADTEPRKRQQALATRTVADALADAGLPADRPGLRLVFGTSYGPHLDSEPGPDGRFQPGSLHRWAADAAAELGAAHPPISVATACSAGADSMMVGLELIRSGQAEIAVCGGADVLTTGKRLGHSRLGTLSPTLLRAFDAGHDGTLLGDGAGFVVLEEPAAAARRGARVRGLLTGAGSSNDAAGLTAPEATGTVVAAAVGRALADAGRTPAEVAVVNAHGSGTPLNDEVEARGLGLVFGAVAAPPVVFATKGAFGHSLGATGALEAIAVLLALDDRRVPPVVGLRAPAADFPLPLAAGVPALVTGPVGLSLTLGFGGFNTCLVLEEAGDG